MDENASLWEEEEKLEVGGSEVALETLRLRDSFDSFVYYSRPLNNSA